MKVLSRNAASLMFEKVKSLGKHHNSWRSIYLNLSGKPERLSRMLHTNFIVKAITSLLADDDGYIYLCDDGDIFILFQGAVRPVIARLSNHFAGLKPEQGWERPGDDLFTIFDLSTQWRPFLGLCKAKAMYGSSLPAEKPVIRRPHYEYSGAFMPQPQE